MYASNVIITGGDDAGLPPPSGGFQPGAIYFGYQGTDSPAWVKYDTGLDPAVINFSQSLKAPNFPA